MATGHLFCDLSDLRVERHCGRIACAEPEGDRKAWCKAAIKYHALVMLHTRSNKITGFLTFLVPVFLMMANPAVIYSVLGIALFSALEELILHLISKNPDLNKRGLL